MPGEIEVPHFDLKLGPAHGCSALRFDHCRLQLVYKRLEHVSGRGRGSLFLRSTNRPASSTTTTTPSAPVRARVRGLL